ncbi:hypothetical protein AAFC00_003417 [Neodothiora populina]|uniref:Xylanolytic transcriptional activator regulatory domain-containing protein n=1 Tax=Neodothiora populina TaxID=2781224 RepID=A0ABR3PE67_9PEZI
MTGKLSLENITHGQNHIDRLAISDVPQFIQADDPIEKGIVNHTIAVALYSTFMRDLNKYICQFDPALHTFDYVRRSSPFLLTAMLAASAKAFKSTSHSGLLNHAEDLLATCFRKGKKSVDIVQAILVLTYWKEPDDTRAWLSVGYVIRMCIELGLHKITPSSQDKDADRDELSIRERRNVERLWLLLYFYDRSLSLQNGSPSMIRRNELIESANTWFDDPWATSHDRLLCALVTLRLIGSEVFDLLNPHRNSSQNTMLDRTDGLMGTFQHDITRWKSRWSSMEESRNDSLYQFFIAFYGTNLRLLFSLFPLHASLTSSLPEESIDKQPLLVSFSSAVEMLQLLARPDYSELLYLVQDSINIMIAYSSIFLIKLLLSVSPEIRSEIEGPAIEAISGASKVFDAQNAPPHSGCGLQAKFLRNVLKVFRKAHKPRQGRSTQPIQTSTQTTSNTNTSIHEVRSDMDLAVGEMLDPTVYNTDHAVGLDYLLDWSEPSFANFDLWPTLSVGANSDMNGTFSLDGLGHMGPFT